MRLILLIIFIVLSGCSEFLILSSGTTAIVSQNTLSKAYNGIDMMTTIQTEKDIKGHAYDKLKGDKK